ncbi:trypsin-like peptidase domain-containing protein [Candidatus Poriferisocius sp.]|uniref:trypsin-like peptidase domain-containing protein n=1 Tax=Candidatus Poriferisocius sp. TaxID=3101276 RepID=UPI003B5A2EE7
MPDDLHGPGDVGDADATSSLLGWARKRWKRLAWTVALVLLGGWILTWVFDAPLRPVLAERDAIRVAAVHVSGTACGQFSEGDGFAVAPDLVLTNAHVVAGVEEIRVATPTGTAVPGVLVGFDPGRDIAAIAVTGPPLIPVVPAPVVADASDTGDVATVNPGHGVEFVPFTVIRRILATGTDFYGEEAQGRLVLEIRSLLVPGDSGAALVSDDGELWGMVFAVARRQRDEGYALDSTEITRFLAEVDRTPVPTPPCRTR